MSGKDLVIYVVEIFAMASVLWGMGGDGTVETFMDGKEKLDS